MRIWTLLLILELIFTSNSWASTSKDVHPWLRACSPVGIYDIEPRVSCPKGIVFKEPFFPKCICLYGVWILNGDMCDSSPYVLVGSGTNNCYSINFKISSIKYIGDIHVAFKPKAYVAPRSMTVFEEISWNGGWTRPLNFKWPVILAINPDKSISFEDAEENQCFPIREKFYKGSENFRVHIWTSVLGRTRFAKVDKCSDPWNSGYDVYSTFLQPYFQSNRALPPPINFCRPLCDRKHFGSTIPTKTTPKTTTMSFLEKLKIFEDFGGLDNEVPDNGTSAEIEAFLDEIISQDSAEFKDPERVGGPWFGFKAGERQNSSNNIKEGSGGYSLKDDGHQPRTKQRPFTQFEAKVIAQILHKVNDTEGGRILEELLENYDWNPDLPRVKKQALKLLRRQKRRSERVNHVTVWGGRGFCINSYWEPKDNYVFTPEEIALCFPDSP